MSNTIKWIRPSGTEIVTANTPEIIEHGRALGWKRADAVEDKPKRVKKVKAEPEPVGDDTEAF